MSVDGTIDGPFGPVDTYTIGKVVENSQGGKQSASPHFFRGLPVKALMWIARVLKYGAETYEPDPFGDVSTRNWHKITSDEHLEHLIEHVVKYLDGDQTEDHIGHIGTRALFFVHMADVEGKRPNG